MRLRVLMEPRRGASYEQILALARAAEEAGLDGFFRGDHYLGIEAAGADTVYFHLYAVGQHFDAEGPDQVRLLGEALLQHAG